VPVAGDVFDQKLVRYALPRHFGEGSTYGPKAMPIPHWIYDTFSSWQTILELQTPQNRRVLDEIAQTARRPRDLRALISLVTGNYALQMFDTVERTKRDLSDRFGGMIRLEGPGFDVMQLVTRREFENVIRPEYLRIEKHLDETVRESGLRPEQLDAVIRTGGSAEIPAFQQMLRQKFGSDRLHSIDTFGSVTAGLGIIAHGIAQGEIDAEGYTPANLATRELTRPESDSAALAKPKVATVSLSLLQRRIDLQEGSEAHPAPDQHALVLLTADNAVCVGIGATVEEAAGELQGSGRPAFPPLLGAVVATPDEPLLLITSRYRFLRTTATQLRALAAIGQSLEELYQFAANEAVYALARWHALKSRPRLLLTTSLGFARTYPTAVISPAIEAPVPLTFEQPLPGWPQAALGAEPGHRLLLFTAAGRGLCYPLDGLPGTGMQVLNRDEDDTIVAALALPDAATILLVTAGGYARRLPISAVHAPEKANDKGRVHISRSPLVAAAEASAPLVALTAAGLIEIDPATIPVEPDTTRSHPLLRETELRFILSPDRPH
jgi:hypothetical protein